MPSHRVLAGQSTSTIAALHGIPVEDLVAANPEVATISAHVGGRETAVFASLVEGDLLRLPDRGKIAVRRSRTVLGNLRWAPVTLVETTLKKSGWACSSPPVTVAVLPKGSLIPECAYWVGMEMIAGQPSYYPVMRAPYSLVTPHQISQPGAVVMFKDAEMIQTPVPDPGCPG